MPAPKHVHFSTVPFPALLVLYFSDVSDIRPIILLGILINITKLRKGSWKLKRVINNGK